MLRYPFLAAVTLLSASPILVDAEQPRIVTVLGTGQGGLAAAKGVGTEVNVGMPFGVEVGPDGCLYTTEVGNHRIWKLDLSSGLAEVVAGTGRKGYSGDGGPALEADLNEPYEVRFDGQGQMYFVEMQNHLIRKVDLKTGIIETVAGTGEAGDGGDGGPARSARFRRPHSIALDGRGGLLVADIGNHRIRRIELETGRIESIAGTGRKQLPQEGEIARGKPVLGPRALYVHGSTLWVALREGHSVWKIDLDEGRWQHVAGTGRKGFGGDGGDARQAMFNGPKGIVADDTAVLVVDTENQTIRRIELAAGTITTVAGRGPSEQGPGGDGGPAVQAQMGRPHGICLGPEGSFFVGDTLNHRVRRVK